MNGQFLSDLGSHNETFPSLLLLLSCNNDHRESSRLNRFNFYTYLLAVFLTAGSASAQFFYFGQNKVQYTQFDWQVMKTEHFDIYYYPEMKDLAERGAALAEESYRVLQDRFNHN